jgi:hypothetical protein
MHACEVVPTASTTSIHTEQAGINAGMQLKMLLLQTWACMLDPVVHAGWFGCIASKPSTTPLIPLPSCLLAMAPRWCG